MKKIAVTLFLALVFVFSLSVNTFAEGEIPTMGRNCGNTGQSPCPKVAAVPTEDSTFYKKLIDYLAQLFG
jgi:hypothetical protein